VYKCICIYACYILMFNLYVFNYNCITFSYNWFLTDSFIDGQFFNFYIVMLLLYIVLNNVLWWHVIAEFLYYGDWWISNDPILWYIMIFVPAISIGEYKKNN